MFHREDPTETATIGAFRQFDDLGILDTGKQETRLAVHTQAAQEVAGGVIGQLSRPATAQI